MNNQTNSSGSFFVFIILLALFTSISASEDDDNPFVIHTLNEKSIFLNLSENEIPKRLGEALNTVRDDTGMYYFYDNLTIRCNDGRVDGVFFASKDFSILNGVRIGQQVYKIPFVHRTVFGFNFFSSANISNEEIEEITIKETKEYKITAKDNLGNKRLLAGEMVDKPQFTYILKLHSSKGKIWTIDLYNSIEISGQNRLIYGDW